MAITPQAGYIVDPKNPNGVIKDPSYSAGPGGVPTAPITIPKIDSTTSTPTAVISSNPAQNDFQQKTDTINQTSESLVQNQQRVANAGKPGFDVFGNPVQTPPPVKPVTPTPETPEQKLMNTPETGNQFIYNQTTGERSEIPTTQTTPAGFTNTDVANAPAVDTATTANSIIKKFSDGSYGMFDVTTGKYVGGASAQNFNDAKGAQKTKDDLVSIQNGTYPLTSAQQAQIKTITDYYQKLVDQQTKSNTNLENAVTGQQYMSGMAGTAIGAGYISKVISDGAQKIATLNNEMVDKVESMKSAIKTDNINLLNSLYTKFQNDVENKQTEIDKMHTETIAALKTAKDKQSAQNIADSDKYHISIPAEATAEQALEIKKTSPIYKYEEQTKGGTADPDVTDAQVKYYKTNGALPTFSYGTLGHAERNAFWSAVGGNPSTVIDATTNKIALHAASTAQAKMQTLKSGTEASLVNLKVGMDNADTEMAKFSRTGSPFLNKPANWIADQLTGNKEYAGLNQALSSVATEYAKIKNGASASIAGAPVTSVEEEKKLINAAMSNGQLKETFDIIKKDSNGRMLGFNQALDSIKSDISDLQSTDVTTPEEKNTSGVIKTNADGTLQAVDF